ncbi:MAG: hypothetical protein PHD01_00005 [Geobacteraceae bacterium]|nr:hypothetical protein [Geobacteraceae bacterium]
MVDDDPVMRLPYLVMEANPDRFPGTNVKGARALSDYLLSKKVQTFLTVFGKDQNELGKQFFYPVATK